MSYDIYLCDECARPIWFPYGEKIHIGTGWYCWREHHEGDAEQSTKDAKAKKFHPPAPTEPDLRRRLADKSTRLYKAWLDEPGKTRLLPFLRKQLNSNRGDVLKDFLKFLCLRREKEVAKLLGQLTLTREWSRHARRLFPVYIPKGRK
jgi:hypothetical protein